MRPTSAGAFDVLDDGVVLATEVSFEAAHEFIHAGCALCTAGEDHTNASVRLESA